MNVLMWRNGIMKMTGKLQSSVKTYPTAKQGKAIPVEVWADPWGSSSLKLPGSPQNRRMKVVRLLALCTGRLYPQEIFPVLI